MMSPEPDLFNYQDQAAKPGPKEGQVKPGAIAGIHGQEGGRPGGMGTNLPAGLPMPSFMQNEELMKAASGLSPKTFSSWDFGL